MTKDASGTVIERYILGGGVDNQLAVITATGTYYFNRDGLGSVVSVTDSTGAVIEKYEYSTFGTPTIKNAAGVEISQSTIGNSFMFTGRMWDDVLGIYDYRNRVYNPDMGVFYQTDPLGYHDSTNMYAYCVNDPVNFVDPFGEVAGDVNPVLGSGDRLNSGKTVDFTSVSRETTGRVDFNQIETSQSGEDDIDTSNSIEITVPVGEENAGEKVSAGAVVGSLSTPIEEDCSTTLIGVFGKGKDKSNNAVDRNPVGKPGRKQQGREVNEKKKKKGWQPRGKQAKLKKHTPGRGHRKQRKN